MQQIFKSCFLLLLVCFILIGTRQRLYAQDTGTPFFEVVTYGTLIGSLGGAIIGSSIWLLDPLNPHSGLNRKLIKGFGLGAVIGAIGGIVYMQMHAIIPIKSNPDDSYDDMADPQSMSFLFPKSTTNTLVAQRQLHSLHQKSLSPIPLFAVRLRF